MFDEIFYKIRTKEELDILSEEVQLLLNTFYQNETNVFESKLKNRVQNNHSKELRNVFAKEGIDKKSYLIQLRDQIEKIEFINIKLSFEPSDDFLDRLSFFIKKNTSAMVVMDITYDPTILGGAEIIYRGNYRDFSFTNIFKSEFEKSRPEILKNLEVNIPEGHQNA